MDSHNLISLAGIVVLMAIGWALSADRRRMNFRVIVCGVGLQLVLGAVVFWTPLSRAAFLWLNDKVVALLGAASQGQSFLFGPLADPAKAGGFVLAIQALPVIIFFAALMALLYHWRVMPLIIRGFSWVFTRSMRISGAESLCAASNIFVGIESATTVRPYLAGMTRSEFCTILTAGMATVASSTMAVYVTFLQGTFPTIAGHLISASILSAPAAVVMSKILVPEDGQPATLGRAVPLEVERYSGSIDAIVAGAMAGVRLVVGICALLIAFMGFIALVNLGLEAVTGRAHGLEQALGYAFRPLAWVIGVPWGDCELAGRLLGERLVVTEIPAYRHLAEAMSRGEVKDPRSAVVIAYSLCGFAHVASMAIFVGGIAALVPQRRADLVSVGPRALLAATLACLMTGAVAGAFFTSRSAPPRPATTAPAAAVASSPLRQGQLARVVVGQVRGAGVLP